MTTHRIVRLYTLTRASDGHQTDFVEMEVEGVGRVAAILPVVPEDASPAVREGFARRRMCVLTGRCGCGAEMDLTKTGDGNGRVEHEDGCPAIDSTLLAALEANR